MHRRGLAELRAGLWLAALTYLADACSLVGDDRIAPDLYAELTPHAGSIVTIGHGVACYGSADRYLGIVAAVSGEHDLARAHLEAALEIDRGMGAWTWLAHTQYELGRLLLKGGDGDPARGHELLQEAGALAERIGMPALLHRIRTEGGAIVPGSRRTGSRRASCRSSSSSRRACPTARSARRSSSASTPRQTTSAASCARPAARTAPRPPRTRTGAG